MPSKIKYLLVIFYLFLLILVPCLSKSTSANLPNSTLFASEWPVLNSNSLQVRVIHVSESADKIEFYGGGKLLTDFQPSRLVVTSIFPLDDGNFASNWIEGVGLSRHLIVFNFNKRKIQNVLHVITESTSPEYFYVPLSSPISDTKYKQVIGCTQVRWNLRNPNSRFVEHVSAHVYGWNEKRHTYERRNLQWRNRFAKW